MLRRQELTSPVPVTYHSRRVRVRGLARDLPKTTDRSKDSAPAVAFGDLMTTAPSPRVLIVDDDPSIRRTLQMLLTRAGYTVTQACDGSEAVRLWRAHGGDLVITDLHMPEKN